jgi:hypothetical protein
MLLLAMTGTRLSKKYSLPKLQKLYVIFPFDKMYNMAPGAGYPK